VFDFGQKEAGVANIWLNKSWGPAYSASFTSPNVTYPFDTTVSLGAQATGASRFTGLWFEWTIIDWNDDFVHDQAITSMRKAWHDQPDPGDAIGVGSVHAQVVFGPNGDSLSTQNVAAQVVFGPNGDSLNISSVAVQALFGPRDENVSVETFGVCAVI